MIVSIIVAHTTVLLLLVGYIFEVFIKKRLKFLQKDLRMSVCFSNPYDYAYILERDPNSHPLQILPFNGHVSIHSLGISNLYDHTNIFERGPNPHERHLQILPFTGRVSIHFVSLLQFWHRTQNVVTSLVV